MKKIIFLILILISIIIILFILKKNSMRRNNYFNDNYQHETLRKYTSRFDLVSADDLKIVLPLWWDSGIGVYKTEIKLGWENLYRKFTVIPDTGSNILIISGPECNKCVPDMGQWDYSIGHQESSTPQIIRYGGGQTTEYILWRAKLMNYDLNNQYSPEVTFGVITSSNIPSGSPQNIMGLQPNGHGFLSNLSHLSIDRSIMFDFPRGQLTIGNLNNELPPRGSIFPMIKSPYSMSGIDFVCSQIDSIRINNRLIPQENTPLYVHFDTGTTNTIVPPHFYDYVKSLGKINSIKIKFIGGGIISSRNNYFNRQVNPSNFSSEVNFSSPTLTTEHLPGNDMIMIGNRWLSNFVFIVAHDTNRIIIY
jgi:hypothetical protein